MEKPNLTQQKHVFSNQKKCTTTQNKQKTFNVQPGNVEGLFLFRHFINLLLTYLLRQTLTHLLTAPDTHRAFYRLDTLLVAQLTVSKH